MLQIAICDDNQNDLSAMEQLITQYRETKKVNCQYTGFSQSLDLVYALKQRKRFDIFCLDIVMPDLTGIAPQPSGVCREGSPLDAAKIIRRFDPTLCPFYVVKRAFRVVSPKSPSIS